MRACRSANVVFDLAVADVDGAIGVRGHVGLVRDDDDGVARLVEPLEDAHDLDAGLRIEIAGGLVGEQNRRIVHEGAGDGHALALPAGELVRAVIDARPELHLVERRARAHVAILGRNARVHERQLDVAQRRRARQQVERLKDEADLFIPDARELVVVHLAHLLAVQEIRAFAGRVEAPDEIHQRRLARARRPHDGHVLAALDLNRHAAQRVDFFRAHHVGFPEIDGFNESH